jgi:hypothetical protein
MNAKISISIFVFVTSVLVGGFFLTSCSKQRSSIPSPVASVNIINALPTSSPLILVQGPITTAIGQFSNINALSYGATAVLTLRNGEESLYALQKNIDTASVSGQGGDYMFHGMLNFSTGDIYSLFITGKDTSSPDYLFVQDTIIQRTDSTAGIRFVNLSTSSNAVSIDIQGQANGRVVPSLAYKAITGFLSFPTTSAISSYTFEFRDAVSGDLLASYVLGGVNTNSSNTANAVLFRNFTIALIGQPVGGMVSQSCILVDGF